MKCISLIFFLLIGCIANGQKITGIWRGTFVQKEFSPLDGRFSTEEYRYEVQINQLANNATEGVTYSYLSTQFYGKAALTGIFQKKNRTFILKETKMLAIKSNGMSEPCLMTCYLDYSKVGKLETLTGTYTSLNVKTKSNCGDGTVYLEKVEDTQFEKEDFLLKKTAPKTAEHPGTVNKAQSSTNNIKENAKGSLKPHVSQSKPVPQISAVKKLKPGAEKFAKGKNIKKALSDTCFNNDLVICNEDSIQKAIITDVPVPKDLKERENKLVNVIKTDAQELILEFYDNGEIDNDTISVYQNNALVINQQRLSYSPITLKLNLSKEKPIQEIIVVAENLGDIPPNTALMVVNGNNKRQEIFLTSDERKNARIIIEYTGK